VVFSCKRTKVGALEIILDNQGPSLNFLDSMEEEAFLDLAGNTAAVSWTPSRDPQHLLKGVSGRTHSRPLDLSSSPSLQGA
jgi:hypothetical protein